MTFYTYGLNADRASSLSYNKVLLTASASTGRLVSHRNPNILSLGAGLYQMIGRPGAPSPFSLDFSAAFGSGAGNHILIAVSKSIGFIESQAAALTRLTFASKFVLAPVASPEVSVLSRTYAGSRLLNAGSPQSAGLFFPRLNHAVIALSHSNIAKLVRINNAFRRSSQTNASNLLRSLGHQNPATLFLSQSVLLARGAALIRGMASPSSIAAVKAGGRIAPHLLQQQVLAIPKTVSRLITLAATSIAQIIRTLPLRVGTPSTETLRLVFGAAANVRYLSVVTAQGLLVQRGLSVSRNAIAAGQASLLKTSARLFTVSMVGIVVALKTVGRPIGTTASTMSVTQRTVNLARQVAVNSGVMLLPAGLHFPTVFRVAQTQVAAISVMLTHTVQMAINRAQASVASLSAMLSYLRTRTTTQAQSAAFAKSPARLIAVALSAAQSSVRSPARLLPAAVASTVALAVQGSGLRLLAVASAMAVAVSRSEALIRAVVTPQAVFLGRQRGLTLFLAGASSISRRILTNKFLAGSTAWAVASGRGDSKIIGTTSANQATMSRPRGILLTTRQAQTLVVATWYWLFVADWAYQQTTLLPPAGGLAEPPSFGPIDPADRTTFAFNWASRTNPNDALVSAVVVSVPPGLTFFGPIFISGYLVEVVVVPSSPPLRPATYSLRCSATFASGRRSSFSIPIPVRTL